MGEQLKQKRVEAVLRKAKSPANAD